MRVGDYELERELGRGGAGVVHQALHVRLGRRVALKRLLRLDGERTRRFEAEAQALARLRHPNIVPIHEVGHDAEGKPFIAMGLVEGRSLERRLAQGPLPAREAATIARDLALALDHAHRAGVLHRDVKPGNVLLAVEAGGRVRPVLTDFGLARELSAERERLTRTGALVGTPAFMAPEQAAGDGERVGPETDVYGLGATLYAMLRGAPPFAEVTSVLALVAAICERAPEPPGVDPRLDAIVLTCLAKAPEDRYPDAGELARDLSRYLAGEAISASGDRTRRLRSPGPVPVALLASLLLAATAVTVALRTSPTPADGDGAPGSPSGVDRAPSDPAATEGLSALAKREDDPVAWRKAAARWLASYPDDPRAAALGLRYLRRGLAHPRRFSIEGVRRPYRVRFLGPWQVLGTRDQDGRFDLWHLRDGLHRGTFGAGGMAAWGVYAGDARVLLQRTGRRSLARWSLSGRRPRRLGVVTLSTTLDPCWAVSADARLLAVLRVGTTASGRVNQVDVFDLAHPEAPPRVTPARPGWNRDLAFAGPRLLILSGEGEVASVDLRRPRLSALRLPGARGFVAAAPAGRGVVLDAAGKLALVDLRDGRRIAALEGAPRPDGPGHVAGTFSVDGARVFVRIGSPGPSWEVWEVDPPRLVTRLPSLAGALPRVRSIVPSPDGARLAGVSCGVDENVLLRWEIAPR